MTRYVSRNAVATDSAERIGHALATIVAHCGDIGEALSPRQERIVIGHMMWAFHEIQLDADRQMLDIPAVRQGMPQRVREAILERDEFRCLACGATEDLEIDHVMPVALGGTNDPENLQVLCSSCNVRKRTDPVSYVASDWRGGKP